jgi:hypothetical protein
MFIYRICELTRDHHRITTVCPHVRLSFRV